VGSSLPARRRAVVGRSALHVPPHEGAEATALRNRILTFVTLLAREARAAGINACHDDELARSRFEAASFRTAMRAIRNRRGRTKGEDPAAEPRDAEKKPDASPPNG